MKINPDSRLEASSVGFRVTDRALLESVDLALRPGCVDVLVGPNGAGKSTLLKLLTGELIPHAGAVRLDGNSLKSFEPDQLARRRACLPQSSALSFPFTIREVVGIGRLPYRDTQSALRRTVEEALEAVELGHRADEAYPHLSGGEKQRVHLARILAQLERPENSVLLLDEPTASLDLTFQQLVFRIATEWAGKGAAVLLVLHDLNQAMRYGDAVTVLDAGRIAAQGEPAKVLTPALIEKVYGVHARWIESAGHRLLAVEGPARAAHMPAIPA